MPNRDLEFLYEIGTLRNMPRGWQQHVNQKVASVSEHMYRVCFLSLVLGRMEGGVNEDRLVKMALFHDLAETRTSDLSYVQKGYFQPDEKPIVDEILKGVSFEDLAQEVLSEYEHRASKEAQIVKDADNLDLDLEMRELEANGFRIPNEWYKFRKEIRDKKLYTESAKKLWDEIQESDIHSWHLKANKHLKIPNAGR